jgi:hypothetical protein
VCPIHLELKIDLYERKGLKEFVFSDVPWTDSTWDAFGLFWAEVIIAIVDKNNEIMLSNCIATSKLTWIHCFRLHLGQDQGRLY